MVKRRCPAALVEALAAGPALGRARPKAAATRLESGVTDGLLRRRARAFSSCGPGAGGRYVADAVGRAAIAIDAVTTKVDVAALYLNAMRRVNAETQSATSHIVPSEPAVTIEVDGKPTGTGTSENGTIS